jgi:hypothetical protein
LVPHFENVDEVLLSAMFFNKLSIRANILIQCELFVKIVIQQKIQIFLGISTLIDAKKIMNINYPFWVNL